MSRYALFLGCTTPTKVIQYELSSRWVCKHLGIELVDIDDFVCCGINQVNLSQEAGLLLAAMNLACAEAKELNILTLCAACTGALAEAIERLKDEVTREKINEKLRYVGVEYKGKVTVKHISRILYEDVGLQKLEKEVKKELTGLLVVPHYGCHSLKPASAFEGFDDPDNPKNLHQLISVTGATPVQYETLNLCCGGKSFPVSKETVFYLVQKKLDNIVGKKIDCMVVQCQTCYLMYSNNQKLLNGRFRKQYNVPVLLYPQLLGLALGGDPIHDLGFDLNAISSKNLLTKLGIYT